MELLIDLQKKEKGFEIPTGLIVSWQRSRELVKKCLQNTKLENITFVNQGRITRE